MNGHAILCFAIGFIILHGPAHGEDRPPLTEEDLVQFGPISATVGRAATFRLYEGLPHQRWEGALLARELKTKKTVEINGFPFYEPPLKVAEADIEPLRRLSAARDSYWTFSGEKLCGGYHPDYCLAWTDGETTCHLLICFGCHEMVLRGPDGKLRVDIRHAAYKQFKEKLTKYHKQRPKADED